VAELQLDSRLRDDGWTVLTVAGEIDIQTAPALDVALQRALLTGDGMVVADLSGVPFLDASGVAALVRAVAGAQLRRGSFRITGCTDFIARLVQLTGLGEHLETGDDLPTASAARFTRPPGDRASPRLWLVRLPV